MSLERGIEHDAVLVVLLDGVSWYVLKRRGIAKDGRRENFLETNSAAVFWSSCDRVEFVVVGEVRLFSVLKEKAQFGFPGARSVGHGSLALGRYVTSLGSSDSS